MTTVVPAGAVVAACVADPTRRAYLGQSMVKERQRHQPQSRIRILRTEGELQSALRPLSEPERPGHDGPMHTPTTMQPSPNSVTGSSGAIPVTRPVPAKTESGPDR